MKDNFGKNKLYVGRILFLFFLLTGIFLLFFVLDNFNGLTTSHMSGKAILELKPSYSNGEILGGKYIISLNKGELLPKDSKLVIKSGSEEKEYLLSELVTNEDDFGNYYLSGINLEGEGLGYGIKGSVENISDVNFVLELFLSENNQDNNGELNNNGESNSDIDNNENENSNNISQENNIEVEESNYSQDNSVENSKEDIEMENNSNSQNEILDENNVEETLGEEKKEGEVENEEEVSGNENKNGFSITGGAVNEGNLDGKKSREVSGIVNKNSPYVIDKKKNENVKIIDSSQDIDLEVLEDKVIVTTSYSDIIQGYGEEFVNGEGDKYVIEIDLLKLNLIPNSSEIEIAIKYNDIELFSSKANLDEILEENISEGESESGDNQEENEFIENESENLMGNETTNVSINNQTNFSFQREIIKLLDEDLFLLKGKFGNQEVKIRESKLVNNRLVIKMEIGEYQRENSYDYSLGEAEIKNQIKEDVNYFLISIVNKLKESKQSTSDVSNYIGNYSF